MVNHPMAGFGQVDNHGDFSVRVIEDAVGGYGDRDYQAVFEATGDFGTLGEPAIHDSSLYGNDGMGFRFKKPKFNLPKISIPKIQAPKVSLPQAFNKIGGRLGLASLAKPKLAIPAAGAALVAVPAFAAAKTAIPKPAQSLVASPRASQSQVVSTGGQISQQKIDNAAQKAIAQKRRFQIPSSQAHPMMMFSRSMGEDSSMGLNFSSIFGDVKKKADEEFKKLKAKAEADLKAKAGQALANIGTSILKKPEVQAAIVEKSQEAALDSAARSIVTAVKDPEVQKKIALGGVGLLALIGGLAFLALRRK
jgi:hypothetical protein